MGILSKFRTSFFCSALLLSAAVKGQNVPAIPSSILPLVSNSLSSQLQSVGQQLNLEGIMHRAGSQPSVQLADLAKQFEEIGGLSELMNMVSEFQQLNPAAFSALAEQLGFGDILAADGQLNQTALLDIMAGLMEGGGAELYELLEEQLGGAFVEGAGNTLAQLAQQFISYQANAGIRDVGLPLAGMAAMAEQMLPLPNLVDGVSGSDLLKQGQMLLLTGVKQEEGITEGSNNVDEKKTEANPPVSSYKQNQSAEEVLQDEGTTTLYFSPAKLADQIALLDGRPLKPSSIVSLVTGGDSSPVDSDASSPQQLAELAVDQVRSIASQAQKAIASPISQDFVQKAKDRVEQVGDLEVARETAQSLLSSDAAANLNTIGNVASNSAEQLTKQVQQLGDLVDQLPGVTSEVNALLTGGRSSLRDHTEQALVDLAQESQDIINAVGLAAANQLAAGNPIVRSGGVLRGGGGVGEAVVSELVDGGAVVAEFVDGGAVGDLVKEMTDLQRQQGLQNISKELGLDAMLTPTVSDVLGALSRLDRKRFDEVVEDMVKFSSSAGEALEEELTEVTGGRGSSELRGRLGLRGGGRSERAKKTEQQGGGGGIPWDLARVVKHFIFDLSKNEGSLL